MHYSENFLKGLAREQVSGDFPPFSNGTIPEVEAYIKTIVGRVKDNYQLVVEPDFSYYGSGFASYITVRVYKKGDRILTKTVGNAANYNTSGLLIYISNLVPYWYYGSSEWSETVVEGQVTGGSSVFLRPESIRDVDDSTWHQELLPIKALFEQHRYRLLTQEEVAAIVDFNIPISTVMAEKPYQVFDYFFHWMD